MNIKNLKNIFFLGCISLFMIGCATYSELHGFELVRGANCSGKNSKWETCYQAAAKDCPKGYQLIEKRDYMQGAQGKNYLAQLMYEAKNGKNSVKQITYRCNK